MMTYMISPRFFSMLLMVLLLNPSLANGELNQYGPFRLSKPETKIIERHEIVSMEVHKYSRKKNIVLSSSENDGGYTGALGVVNKYIASLFKGEREILSDVLDRKRLDVLEQRTSDEFKKVVQYYKKIFANEKMYVTHKINIFDIAAFIVVGISEDGEVRSKLPVYLRNTESGWKVTNLNSGEIDPILTSAYPYDKKQIVRTRSIPAVSTARPKP